MDNVESDIEDNGVRTKKIFKNTHVVGRISHASLFTKSLNLCSCD